MSIIFITGANEGLGYESARRLIELGHKVYIGSRNEERGIQAAKELGAKLIIVDVTDDESVKKAALSIEKTEGHIDVLINNAGISGIRKNVTDINSLTYCSAKAAVLMLTVQYAKGLPNMKVNCVDPGSTATDLNRGRGLQTVYEGTDAIVKLATIGKDGPTGTFSNRLGEIPW